MRLFKQINLGSLCIALAGCLAGGLPIDTADGPSFQVADPPGAERALLYVYRPWHFGSAAAAPEIFLNDEKALLLYNGGYGLAVLDPGGVVLSTRRGAAWSAGRGVAMWLTARPGRTYYVRVNTSTGFGSSDFVPELVPEDVALGELPKTRQLATDKEVYEGKGNIREPLR